MSTLLTKKEICKLWGVRHSYVDCKISEVLLVTEQDISQSYILQKLNEHGMDVESVVMDLIESYDSNDENSAETMTSLHEFPMLGPFDKKTEFKWNCDNKKCTKHRVQRAYNMSYFKSKELSDAYTLCQKCVSSNTQTNSPNPLEINQNIANTNNSNKTRKRKREQSQNDENIDIEPRNKKRKITQIMNTLSLSDSESNHKNEAIAIIVSILEENTELTRDKLLSKLNAKIAENNGINWRKKYRSTLGKFDEFVTDNDRFIIVNERKRNYTIQLNDKKSDESAENKENDKDWLGNILWKEKSKSVSNDIEITETEQKQISIGDHDSESESLKILPNSNNNNTNKRKRRCVVKRRMIVEESMSDSIDIDCDDSNDSDYELSDSPTDNVFALYRWKSGKRSRTRKPSNRNSNTNSNSNNAPPKITNTSNTKPKSSMKAEADSDDEPIQIKESKPSSPPRIINHITQKIVKKWKYKAFNPLKIKYTKKAKKVRHTQTEIDRDERHRRIYRVAGIPYPSPLKLKKSKTFQDLKPLSRLTQLRELTNGASNAEETVTAEYDKKYICKDKAMLKRLYNKAFQELMAKPKKPKPKKNEPIHARIPQKKNKEKKDYTIQAKITKSKGLHKKSETVTKRYSAQIEFTLNRLSKSTNTNCFKVDIPATIALTARSKELTQDIIESIHIMDEYRGKGHENTSISLLDFSCRYNDGPMPVFQAGKSCKICYGHMTKPHKLACGHTFCEKCVYKRFIDDDFNFCPVRGCYELAFTAHGLQQFLLAYGCDSSDEESKQDSKEDSDESRAIKQEKYGLTCVPFPYQIQSIEWMIAQENDKIGLYKYLFKRGEFKNGEIFHYSAVLERLTLSAALPKCNGGWLCEEMGLGKTVECLAVIHCNKRQSACSTSHKNIVAVKETAKRKRRVEVKQTNNFNPWNTNRTQFNPFGVKPKKPKKVYKYVEEEREFTYYKGKGTLIIGPVSLIGQWENEVDTRSKGHLSYKRYYGQRSRNVKSYLDFDVIFTTYGVVAKEDGMDRKNHVLHKIEWHRIILDESHYIKNGTCRTALNINQLKGSIKWLLSGTPFNTTADLENQLRFLGVQNEHLNAMKPKKGVHGHYIESVYTKAVVKVVKYMMMRHKKGQKFNNKPIVSMPDKSEDVIYVQFDAKQKEYYDKLYKTAKETFDSYKATGNISRGFIPILASLHPARQACSGFIANMNQIERDLEQVSARTAAIQSMVRQNRGKSAKELYELARVEAYNKDSQCVICLEAPPDEPLQTVCNHIFCGECIQTQLEVNGTCPICRRQSRVNQLKRPMSEKKESESEGGEGVSHSNNSNNKAVTTEGSESESAEVTIKFDAKLKVLVQELNKLQRERPKDKSLIFTSFSKSLDWICSELDRNGIKYCTLSGSMPMNKRANNLKQFSNDSETKVFVLTVRTGAVGLTLTAANHVFMMEPTFNPSLHRQAINRVYRLGQKKKVFIHTLIMKDSIEERIWNVNKEKQSGDIDNKKNKNMYGNIKEDKAGGLESSEIEKLFEER